MPAAMERANAGAKGERLRSCATACGCRDAPEGARVSACASAARTAKAGPRVGAHRQRPRVPCKHAPQGPRAAAAAAASPQRPPSSRVNAPLAWLRRPYSCRARWQALSHAWRRRVSAPGRVGARHAAVAARHQDRCSAMRAVRRPRQGAAQRAAPPPEARSCVAAQPWDGRVVLWLLVAFPASAWPAFPCVETLVQPELKPIRAIRSAPCRSLLVPTAGLLPCAAAARVKLQQRHRRPSQ